MLPPMFVSGSNLDSVGCCPSRPAGSSSGLRVYSPPSPGVAGECGRERRPRGRVLQQPKLGPPPHLPIRARAQPNYALGDLTARGLGLAVKLPQLNAALDEAR